MNKRQKPLDRFLNRILTSVRKKLRLGHSLDELEPELVGRELLFRAPPLSTELVESIQRISPQFHLSADEKSRRFWELNQNGLCWGEYEALAPVLEAMGVPSKVLDIGPGMGRSVAFFKKKLDWHEVPFHLYESTGRDTNYTKAGPRFDDSFCGDLTALETVLRHNEVEAYEVFDAVQLGSRLEGLPGPYDFIYSFFAIGFHWSLEHFLEEILNQMNPRAIGAFTLHDRFRKLEVLDGQVGYRELEFRRSWPRGRWSRLLVLCKDEDALRPLDGSPALRG